jgi:predicted metal-dependent enzyme (double-stranded beta helix superfamily)
MSRDDSQDTRESPALDEVELSPEDVQSIGDPAAAGTDAVGDDSAPVGGGDSPQAAQNRAHGGDESPLDRPEVQILGAFVGAFVLAKLLQWLFGRD